jgi:hypothetical protein
MAILGDDEGSIISHGNGWVFVLLVGMKETPRSGPVTPELIIACFVVTGFIVTLFYGIF